jgi:imidazolonepropionase-like amidohydrolase
MSFFSKIAPIAILLFLSSLIAQPKSSRHLQILIFTHVTVIDATGAPVKPHMSVVITGDRITAIGRSGKVRIPKDAQIINASG